MADRIAVIDDFRRHEGFLSQGLARMVLTCQSAFEDVEGALAAGWMEAAAFQARTLILNCLAVLGMREGAGLNQWIDDVGYDRVGFAPPDMRDRARDLLEEGWTLAANPERASAWLADLRSFFEDTESAFDLGERLPVLRSPEGMFAAIRVLQAEQPVIEQLGLPQVIPRDWTEELTK